MLEIGVFLLLVWLVLEVLGFAVELVLTIALILIVVGVVARFLGYSLNFFGRGRGRVR